MYPTASCCGEQLRRLRMYPHLHRYVQVKLLLAHGADVNRVDDKQFAPLHAGVLQGHDKCVRLLCEV